MANETPKQPTVSDVMELVKSMQSNIEKMGTAMAEALKTGMRDGMAMAALAREQADLSLENARAARKNLGSECPKCRMPMKVCGGPEMKKVETPKLDEKGRPVLGKDGKPEMVATSVEATKWNEEDANHVKMVVLPSDRAAARWFQFIGLNGVRFASRRSGRPILVPRKNDFASILNTFTEFENNFRQSRKVSFQQGKRWAPKPIHFAGKDSPLGPRMVS